MAVGLDSAFGLGLAASVAGSERSRMGILKEQGELGTTVRAEVTARVVGSPVRGAAPARLQRSGLEWALTWNSR